MKLSKQIKILATSDSELLNDEEYIKNFMIKAVEKIGMQVLDSPFVYNVPLQLEKLGVEPFQDSGGITSQILGFITLSTSHLHLAVHVFSLEKKLYLDIFSCKEFSKQCIKKFVKDEFKCTTIKVKDISKACEW